MAHKIKFTKMHGAGNDYIYVNTFLYRIDNPNETAIRWSNRHKGIGGDGLVLIGAPSKGVKADYSMRIFNTDGSEAMMCGNASRCIGKYLYDKGMTHKTEILLETLSGIKTLQLHIDSQNKVESVTVDMLEPLFSMPQQFDESIGNTLEAGPILFTGTFVSMGNPHFVIFTDDVEVLDVARYGSLLEQNKAFPQRCNIEFAQVTGPDKIRTRVWERGSGITQACGTGACATAVAALKTGRATNTSSIIMDGGTIDITWNSSDNHVYMTGRAAFCFEGETEL